MDDNGGTENGGGTEMVGRLLVRTGRALRTRFDAELAAHGTTAASYSILRELVAQPGLNQRQLAERVEVEGPTLTRQLERMERDGLVQRRRDADDRRSMVVEVTPEARRRYEDMQDVIADIEAELLAGLSPDQRRSLRAGLLQVRTNLDLEPAAGRSARPAVRAKLVAG